MLAEQGVERLIEVGPGSKLVNMAKRTIDSKYKESDLVSGIRRNFLTPVINFNEIYYHEDQVDCEPDPTSSKTLADSPTEMAVDARPALAAVVPPAPRMHHEAQMLPDAPITAAEVVKAVVASALRKSTDEVSMGDTIRGLAAGLFSSPSQWPASKLRAW